MLTASFALLLLAIGGYAALCAIQPFGTCRKCRGIGYRLRRTRTGAVKRGKPCRRCRTHGKRLRIGRRLHQSGRRLHRDGTRTHTRSTDRKETLPWQ
ncbi:hypothetical protein SAMN05428945_2205 [Streptomyces sp. 2224.1]|uniref:hypothetical protein n=1 Tax=Streptomyces sp. 2224.1 TaxID=1881020 RepID=UPI000898A587|nr:hypothetical protein [Streptomyces sp. 2224.1]SEC16510.1 hypothetical protein SAMN05428945_2205 [Streptomyces sp. 2224.1]